VILTNLVELKFLIKKKRIVHIICILIILKLLNNPLIWDLVLHFQSLAILSTLDLSMPWSEQNTFLHISVTFVSTLIEYFIEQLLWDRLPSLLLCQLISFTWISPLNSVSCLLVYQIVLKMYIKSILSSSNTLIKQSFLHLR